LYDCDPLLSALFSVINRDIQSMQRLSTDDLPVAGNQASKTKTLQTADDR
jgi:hypothetical protein